MRCLREVKDLEIWMIVFDSNPWNSMSHHVEYNDSLRFLSRLNTKRFQNACSILTSQRRGTCSSTRYSFEEKRIIIIIRKLEELEIEIRGNFSPNLIVKTSFKTNEKEEFSIIRDIRL